MKKIYSLVSCLALSGILSAQLSNQVNTQSQKINRSWNTQGKNTKTAINAKTASIQSTWLNYNNDLAAIVGYTPAPSATYLFPDSTVQVDFGGTLGNPSIHSIGNILDLKSIYFQPKITVNKFSALTLDSMSIEYFYERKTASSITDTLLIYLYTNASAANMPTYYYAGSLANYGVDTVYFKGMPYTYTSNKPSASGTILKKVLLTTADSAANGSMKDFLVNMTIPAGKLVGCGIAFKPGYTYTVSQNISATANTFGFTSYEEKGANTFASYIETHSPAYANADWNCSQIANSSVRYNINTLGYNGLYLPNWAFTQAYRFENHGIWYKVKNANVGINELEANGATLGQNVPNPFNGESTITYQLAKDANSVLFTVTDVMGRVISSEKANANAGTHTIKLGTYAAGVYYYTLNVDGNTITKKMIAE